MKHRVLSFLAVGIAGINAAYFYQAFKTPTSAELNLALVESFILPAYEANVQYSNELFETIQQYCDTSGTIQTGLRQAFEKSYLAWRKADFVDLDGPAHKLTPYAFLVFPDKRGVVRRTLNQAVSSSERFPLSSVEAGKGRIALKGYGALERLLLDDEFSIITSDQNHAAHCEIAVWSAASLKTSHQFIYDHWVSADESDDTPLRTQFQIDQADEIHDENSALLMRSLLAGTRGLVERLAYPLGIDHKRPRPRKTEMPLSQLSLKAIRVSNAAMAEFYVLGLKPRIKEVTWAGVISENFDLLQAKLDEINLPLETAVSEEKHKVQAAYEQAVTLHELVQSVLPDLLGLNPGFNFTDGD